jgi:prevent-host-death family protein
MAIVGAFEAKTRFAQLLQRVERGEEVAMTWRGKAVARIVPAAATPDRGAVLATFRRLREHARQAGLNKFDRAEWRTYRDQGRPGPRWLGLALSGG